MKHLIFLFMLLTSPIAAQQVPGLYNVTNVAADDVLNIRENPRASAGIIGELGPYQNNVEVVGLSGDKKWGLVNIEERSGWVAMAFLTLDDRLESGSYLDKPLRCFGTEPFWQLTVRDNASKLAWLGVEDEEFDITFSEGPVNRMPGRGMMIAQSGGSRLTATVIPNQCHDGMSDQTYGLSIDLLYEQPSQSKVLQGCCQLTR
ncbi:SH3 domain-containing protein [Halovulum sp. GXIMD14793]